MASIRLKYSIEVVYHLHNFKHLHLYSTKSPSQLFANYLINNLGFSHQQALSTSTKLPSKNTSYFKSSDNADSVVHFLKQHGFDDAHIKKVVSSYPRILASNVDKTLKPKIKLLQDHGFSGSSLVSVISTNPVFLLRNLDPIIHDLRAVFGSDENLTKLFTKCNAFITIPAIKNLVSNVALLNNEYCVDTHVIRNSMLQHPACFLRKPEFFQNVLIRVEEELGIPRISRMFLYGMRLLCTYSKQTIESRCELLKSFGWTEYDISELMRRHPNALLKSDENIRKKLGFLMTELGYKPDYLATHSAMFICSLEKRMVPRCRVLLVLKEKGLLDYNFYTAICHTETRFLKTLIEPFKEDVPGLLQLYQKSKGCSNVDTISS